MYDVRIESLFSNVRRAGSNELKEKLTSSGIE
jgi:hypothetical protein